MKTGFPAYRWPSSHRTLRETMIRPGLQWPRKHCRAWGIKSSSWQSQGTGAVRSVRVTMTSLQDVGRLAGWTGADG